MKTVTFNTKKPIQLIEVEDARDNAKRIADRIIALYEEEDNYKRKAFTDRENFEQKLKDSTRRMLCKFKLFCFLILVIFFMFLIC